MACASPRITGLVESILYVTDLPRAIGFYRDTLGLEMAGGDPNRFQAFLVAPGQVLLLFRRGATLAPIPFPGGVIPPHDGSGPQHVGFGIGREAYAAWKERLQASQLPIESETSWPTGGRSLYFRDPDGHLVELLTPGVWPNY